MSDDTYWRLDWCYSINWRSDESYQVMKVIKWWKSSSEGDEDDDEDLTDVSDDTYWRLDWCYSSDWGYW